MRRLLKHQLRFAQRLDASKGLIKIRDFDQASVSESRVSVKARQRNVR
jgi:hypothetical protein